MIAQLGILELIGNVTNANIDFKLTGAVSLGAPNELKPINDWLSLSLREVSLSNDLILVGVVVLYG